MRKALVSFASRFALVVAGSSVLGSAALAGPEASRGPADAALEWGCWHNGIDSLNCLLLAAPPDSPAPPSAAAATGRPVLRAIAPLRETPSRFRGRIITIPVFTPAIDEAAVLRLAHAVMCGDRTDCRVEWWSSLDTDKLMAAGWDD